MLESIKNQSWTQCRCFTHENRCLSPGLGRCPSSRRRGPYLDIREFKHPKVAMIQFPMSFQGVILIMTMNARSPCTNIDTKRSLRLKIVSKSSAGRPRPRLRRRIRPRLPQHISFSPFSSYLSFRLPRVSFCALFHLYSLPICALALLPLFSP